MKCQSFAEFRDFSCSYRFWKKEGKRSMIHGYSLRFKFVFEADILDEEDRVYDLTNTDWIRSYLEEAFDHTLAIVLEDPLMDEFMGLEEGGGCDLRYMEGVGVEKFAEMVYMDLSPIVIEQTQGRAKIESVTVIEEGGAVSTYKLR
jgi:hypothetical protein